MPYDSEKGKELVPEAGITAEGIVINIDDRQVKDFVTLNEEQKRNWKGDLDSEAINLTLEIFHDNKKLRIEQFFTYKTNNEGQTEYGKKSNLGKYNTYYGKLPQVGDRVKTVTDVNGFFRLLIE